MTTKTIKKLTAQRARSSGRYKRAVEDALNALRASSPTEATRILSAALGDEARLL